MDQSNGSKGEVQHDQVQGCIYESGARHRSDGLWRELMREVFRFYAYSELLVCGCVLILSWSCYHDDTNSELSCATALALNVCSELLIHAELLVWRYIYNITILKIYI